MNKDMPEKPEFDKLRHHFQPEQVKVLEAVLQPLYDRVTHLEAAQKRPVMDNIGLEEARKIGEERAEKNARFKRRQAEWVTTRG